MNTLEQVILLCLGTPERLREYIDTDTDLVKYIKEKYFYLFGLAVKIIPSKPRLIEDAKAINNESILKLFEERRPDLYTVLTTHPNGLEWFNAQRFQDLFTLI